MMPMRNIKLVAKNTAGHSLAIAISLLFSIVGARLLPAADFGELRNAMTLLPLFMAFSLPGYDSVILRNANLRRDVPLKKIFYVRFSFALFGSAIMLVTTFIFGDAIAIYMFGGELSDSLKFFIVVSAILLPFYETGTGFRNFLIGKRLRDSGLNLSILSRTASLTSAIMLFSLIYFSGINRLYIFPAYLVSMIFPTLFSFFLVVVRQKKQKIDRGGKVEINAAFAATLAGWVYTLAYSLDKLIVRHDLGAAELASYAILIMAPQELSKLFDATVPLFYRDMFFEKSKFKILKYWRFLFLFPFAALVYSVCFYKLSGFVFGAQYQYSFVSVIISSIMIGSFSFEYMNNHRIFATSGSRTLFWYSLFNLFLTAPILIFFLSIGGINGIMLGLILKQCIAPFAFLQVQKLVWRKK